MRSEGEGDRRQLRSSYSRPMYYKELIDRRDKKSPLCARYIGGGHRYIAYNTRLYTIGQHCTHRVYRLYAPRDERREEEEALHVLPLPPPRSSHADECHESAHDKKDLVTSLGQSNDSALRRMHIFARRNNSASCCWLALSRERVVNGTSTCRRENERLSHCTCIHPSTSEWEREQERESQLPCRRR